MSSRIKSVKNHKSTLSILKSNKKNNIEKIVLNYLQTKYSHFEYSYSLVCLNNLIFNEHCRIVAQFKDYLILDDMTEFLRRFYSKRELKKRLIKIFNFYESYSKIFPNYMILDENIHLYKNIRKKQKMIDAFNQIKKEEEENRKSLKKKEKGEIIIFNKSIQESINRYHPSGGSFLYNSIMSEFMKNNNGNNNESNFNSLISISMNKQSTLNNKNKFSNKNSNLNSFEYSDNNITLNSENSLVNIVQFLNAKFENINYNTIDNNNKNKCNNQNISKKINNYIEKDIKNKNLVKKDTKSNKSNIINKNNIKNDKSYNVEKIDKENNNIINNNNLNLNISTPQKTISPIQRIKKHNYQKSALNNNKKFISHKTAVSVSNNNKNTIKIINNINNIIINDSNINKEMVININTNYFELNSTNLNTLNKINNNNIKKNIRNIIFKKVNINSNSNNNNKKSTLNNKKNILYPKKININLNNQNNLINDNLEEKRMITYNNKIINLENHHYNSKSNNINYENSNIINNNVINIHNTTNHINTSKNKKNESKIKNYIANKGIRGITEYKSININNIKNNNNYNKIKNNYIKNDKNKKTITIDIRSYEKNKKNQSKKKKLKILMVTDSKRITNKPIFNTKTQNKKTFEIMNTEGNINSDSYSKTNINYYNNTDYSNNNALNLNDKNIYQSVKSSQIKTKLNKKILTHKQKTNSLHINNKNNFFSSFCNSNKIVKELNLLKNYNILENNYLINESIKNYTQNNFCLENKKTKKLFAYKDKNISERKTIKKINTKEMKEKYHKFIQRNKIIHGSYDTSNRLHIFKKFSSLYNNSNVNSNNNTTEISHGKIFDIKSPFKYSNIINTPGNKVLNTNDSSANTNKVANSYKNHEKSSQLKKLKMKKKEIIQDKNKHFLFKINGLKNQIFICDVNNKKMKFVKK